MCQLRVSERIHIAWPRIDSQAIAGDGKDYLSASRPPVPAVDTPEKRNKTDELEAPPCEFLHPLGTTVGQRLHT